jgi:hypothetical protein
MPVRIVTLCLLLLLASATRAQDDAPPVYVPPDVGAPETRVAAASRGTERCVTSVTVLAPPHTGLTRAAVPTIWWFVEADCGHPAEVTLLPADGFAEAPLLQRRLAPPAAGFHATTLDDPGATLEAGRTYRFNVALVVDEDRRSADVFASATLRWAPPAAGETSEDARSLAAAGRWYDAFDRVMERSGTEPGRRDRAALLGQVGLDAAAASTLPVNGP